MPAVMFLDLAPSASSSLLMVRFMDFVVIIRIIIIKKRIYSPTLFNTLMVDFSLE